MRIRTGRDKGEMQQRKEARIRGKEEEAGGAKSQEKVEGMKQKDARK